MIITVRKSDETIPYAIVFCKEVTVFNDSLEVLLFDGDKLYFPTNAYNCCLSYEDDLLQNEVNIIKKMEKILEEEVI